MHIEDRMAELEREVSQIGERTSKLEMDTRGMTDWLARQEPAPAPASARPASACTPITLDITVDQTALPAAFAREPFPDYVSRLLTGAAQGVLGSACAGIATTVGAVPFSALLERLEAAETLLRAVMEDSECWFDHHGGCQEHGFLDLQPGDVCPNAAARDLLNTNKDGESSR